MRNMISRVAPDIKIRDFSLAAFKNKLASKGSIQKMAVLKTGPVLPARMSVKRTPEMNAPAASAAQRPPIKIAAGEQETICPLLASAAKMGKDRPTSSANGPQARALWIQRSARGISSPVGTRVS